MNLNSSAISIIINILININSTTMNPKIWYISLFQILFNISQFLLQVRATNLQELVYKNGQAGVTKATVSILFDNSDRKQSPLGYEQYDEITITRQVCMALNNVLFSITQ